LNSLGPEGGALPSGYGSGTPPPIKAPQQTGPPAYPSYPTAGGGFPDPSSYGVNMPGQSQTYYQQPIQTTYPTYPTNPTNPTYPTNPTNPTYQTYGAPPPDYKPPSSEQHIKGKEQKSSGDNDWMKTAGIAVAAAAGAGALGFLGGKLYEEEKDKHHHEKDHHEHHHHEHHHKDKYRHH